MSVEIVFATIGLVVLGVVLYALGERNWKWEKRDARECVVPAPVIG